MLVRPETGRGDDGSDVERKSMASFPSAHPPSANTARDPTEVVHTSAEAILLREQANARLRYCQSSPRRKTPKNPGPTSKTNPARAPGSRERTMLSPYATENVADNG